MGLVLHDRLIFDAQKDYDHQLWEFSYLNANLLILNQHRVNSTTYMAPQQWP